MSSSPSPSPSSSPLSPYKLFIFDCDGVLWHDEIPVPGAISALRLLHSLSISYCFVTNNSSKSRKDIVNKFRKLGFGEDIPIDESIVFTSAYAAAYFIKCNSVTEESVPSSSSSSLSLSSTSSSSPSPSSSSSSSSIPRLSHPFNPSTESIFIVGDRGISHELSLLSLPSIHSRDLLPSPLSKSQLISLVPSPSISIVVVGIDDEINYTKVAYASIIFQHNPHCSLIATNLDSTLPTSGNFLPGGGSCVQWVETASGKKALDVGKPNDIMMNMVLKRFNMEGKKGEVVMVGDRLETDILFAIKGGVQSILVLSGVHKEKDVKEMGIQPTHIYDSVDDFFKEKEKK